MFNRNFLKFFFVVILSATFLFPGTIRAQQFITKGLISFWSFDKETIDGNILKDLWGNNHGTLMGDAKTGEGKIRDALELDGSGDYVNIGQPIDIPKGNDTYAIEVWFYADLMKIGGIIGWGTWGSSNQVNAFRIGTDVNGFRHYWWGNDLDKATGDISQNWHHAIAQFDGKARSLWLDGEMINSDQPVGHNAQIADVNIGVTNNRSEFWDGRFDEMRLYNRALDENEILQNYKVTSNVIAVASFGKISAYWGRLKNSR